MNKKMTLSVALVAILALTGLTALAAGTNLFGFFAARDGRFGKVAEQAGKVTAAPEILDSDGLGTVSARIDSAYYDGQALSVGFVIENVERVERFTPTEEQMTEARLLTDGLTVPIVSGEETRAIVNEFMEAVERRDQPCGYAIYNVYARDHMYANGVDLPPWGEVEEKNSDGAYMCIRNVDAPLPEEIQNQEKIEVKINLAETGYAYYFDGKNVYALTLSRRDLGAITAIVPRSKGQTRAYAGSAEIGGVTFTAEAALGVMNGSMRITTDTAFFAAETLEYQGTSWEACPWVARVFDENGREYYSGNECKDGRLEVSLDGSGELPTELRVYFTRITGAEESEFWPATEDGTDVPHLVLKIAE